MNDSIENILLALRAFAEQTGYTFIDKTADRLEALCKEPVGWIGKFNKTTGWEQLWIGPAISVNGWNPVFSAPQPVVMGWQPIEKAPKNKLILVGGFDRNRDWIIWEAEYIYDKGCDCIDVYEPSVWRWRSKLMCKDSCLPTHWIEKPEPPR